MWGDISLWIWFAFPWWLIMLIIFSCTCWSSVCLLWRNVLFRSSAQIVFLFFCFFVFAIELYEFFVFFRCMICNYFLHSIGCLFILLIVSFAVHKFLAWCSPTCWFLPLLLLLLLSDSKNHHQDQCQGAYHAYFLPDVLWFQVLRLSLNHFELIFVYGVR